MRENPQFAEGTIHAKDALILWDGEKGLIEVVKHGKPYPEFDHLPSSGGAAYWEWQHGCNDPLRAQVLCLKMFWELVYRHEMDPVIVDDALSNIIEYQNSFRMTVGPEVYW